MLISFPPIFARTYKKSNAKKSFIRQLGHNQAPGGNGELLSSGHSATNYFAKGHLTPDASAVYEYQQRATYYFINVAPQFQAFNNGNWKFLEIAARKLAAKYVYTGVLRGGQGGGLCMQSLC